MKELFVERLKAKDCKELIALIDEVFTLHNGTVMDFATLFPRIAVEDDEKMSWYYAIRENGKLVGCAASHPFYYHVGGEVLKVSSGGNVAVSPACRNRGFMQKIMHTINADMDAEGFDFAILHGDRKRYRTFGFERCGIEYTITFSRASVTLSRAEATDTFGDLRNESAEVLAEVMELAKAQPGYVERKAEEWIPAQLTHYGEPLVIRNAEGEIIGYTALSIQEAVIRELALKDPADLGHVIASLIAYSNLDSLYIRMAEYDALLSQAVALSSRYQIIQPGNFRIVRFDNTVRAFMKAKSAYAPLLDGVLTLDTALFGKWAIEVKDGNVTVSAFDGVADLVISDYQLHSFIFGPVHPIVSGVDCSKLSADKAKLVGNWFPLPIFFPHLT